MINTLNIVLGLVTKQQLRGAGEEKHGATVPRKCEGLQYELYLTGKLLKIWHASSVV